MLTFAVLVASAGCAAEMRDAPTGGSQPQQVPPPSDGPLVVSGCGPQLGQIPSLAHGRISVNVGSVFQVACPAGCQQHPSPIWGTDAYTGDSGVCSAAVHAGAVSPDGGVVTVRVEPPLAAYEGSKRNGVGSLSWDTTRQGDTSRKSYVFAKP
jgi:hypothetical protein